MPAILLAVKGCSPTDSEFAPFAELDTEADFQLTWKTCTKVKGALENGSRLENLSWRLWHLHLAMVTTSHKMDETEFKQLSSKKTKSFIATNRVIPRVATASVPATTMLSVCDPIIIIDDDDIPAVKTVPTKSSLLMNMDVVTTGLKDKIINVDESAPAATAVSAEQFVPVVNETLDMIIQKGTDNGLTETIIGEGAEKAMLSVSEPENAMASYWAELENRLVMDDVLSLGLWGSDASLMNPNIATGTNTFATNTQNPAINQSHVYPVPSVLPNPNQANLAMVAELASYPPLYSIHSPVTHTNQQEVERGPIPADTEDDYSRLPATHAFALAGVQRQMRTGDSGVSAFYYEEPEAQHMKSVTTDKQQKSDAEMARMITMAAEKHIVNSITKPDTPSPAQVTVKSTPPKKSINKGKLPVSSDGACRGAPAITTPAANSVPLPIPNPAAPGPPKKASPAHAPAKKVAAPRRKATRPNKMVPTPSAPKSRVAGAPQTVTNGDTKCHNCQATSTPLWRRSLNDELLCNACGLYFKLHSCHRPKSLRSSQKEEPVRDSVEASCFNCATTRTPLWRRDEEGNNLCNACGLYVKLHGEKRPTSLKTDIVRKRTRGSESSASSSKKVKANPLTQPPVPTTINIPSDPNTVPPPPIHSMSLQQGTPPPHPDTLSHQQQLMNLFSRDTYISSPAIMTTSNYPLATQWNYYQAATAGSVPEPLENSQHLAYPFSELMDFVNSP